MSKAIEQLFMSPEQVKRCLLLAWHASLIARNMQLDLEIPVALVGDTGTGKTKTAEAFHRIVSKGMKKEKIEIKWYKMILSLLEASEIGGFVVPDIKAGKAKHLMLDSMPFDTDDWAIICADEIDRSTPEVQNTYLQILLGKEFHGHRLSPNAFNIVTLNGSADIYTTPLSKAARTRMCSLFMTSEGKAQQDSYDMWAEEKGMPEIVRIFNRTCPPTRAVHVFEELAEDTPRTRDMCAMLSLARKRVDDSSQFQTSDIYLPMLSGLIGHAAAVQWNTLEELLKQGGIMPKDVLSNPTSCEVPGNVSYIYFLLFSILGMLKNEKVNKLTKARNAVIFAKRLKSEWQMIWRHQLGVSIPDVIQTKEYINWKIDGM